MSSSPISIHSRVRKYDALSGWYDWVESSIHFDVLQIPFVYEPLEDNQSGYPIELGFIPVCSMDELGRTGVVCRYTQRAEDDTTYLEIQPLDQTDLGELIVRLVCVALQRGAHFSWPAPISCGAYEPAIPTYGVFTGEDDQMTTFTDPAQRPRMEAAHAHLIHTWEEGLQRLTPPADPSPSQNNVPNDP